MNDNTIRLSKNSLTPKNSLLRRLKVKLGMKENESFDGNCRVLGSWTKYEFSRLYGHSNDFVFFVSDVFRMLQDQPSETRYNILYTNYEETEVLDLSFNQLINYLRNDWQHRDFIIIQNQDYSRVMICDKSGYSWKNFKFADQKIYSSKG